MELDWKTVPLRNLRRGTSDVDVHTARWDGPGQGPVFVCVHGLGGSHVNWALLAPRLARHGTVWAPDMAGFGLTPRSGRRADVRDNRDLLAGFIRTVSPDTPVVLLGNSLGGLLSMLMAAAHPEMVAGLVLIAPASPRPVTSRVDRNVLFNFAMMAVPGVGERALALRQRLTTPEQQVRQTLKLSGADYDTLDPATVAAHVELARRRRELPYARAALLEASRSMLLLIGPRGARVWQAVEDVRSPTLLLHGGRDQLVVAAGMAALTRRRPDWTFITYDDLGHIPMLEAPDRVADDIDIWIHAQLGVPIGA
jgi:pimeloyl-ACP methyl ester carboxylesterase